MEVPVIILQNVCRRGGITVKQGDYSIHSFSVKLGSWLGGVSNQPEKSPVFAYGAEIILGAIVKILVFIAVGAILDILPILAVMVIASGSLRLVAGGAHCTAFYRCLIFSLVTYVALGLFLDWQTAFLTGLSTRALIIPLLLCLILNLRWAPCSPDNKPLSGESDILSRKIGAVLICAAFSLIVILVGASQWWVWAVITGMLSESLTLTPGGEWFVACCDKTLIVEFQRKEAESHG